MEKLPGDYIAGFVDGEGCFALKFIRSIRRERKGSPVYFYWDVAFVIMLKADDIGILEKIKNTLDCGKISINKRGFAQYSVEGINELVEKIAPFFEKHRLYAKKYYDFLLWKEALEILNINKQKDIPRTSKQIGFLKIDWNKKDWERLINIYKEMRKYKGGTRKLKWLETGTIQKQF